MTKSVVLPESQKVVRVPFKVFRGMASIGAMVDRLDVEDADAVDVETLGAEGLEVSVPLRGSARPSSLGCSSICAPRSVTAARAVSRN